MHGEVVHGGDGILLLLARREQEQHLAHIKHAGIEHAHQRYAVRAFLVAASEDHEAAFVLVGQELETLGAFERMDVFVLLVEEDRVWLCQCVEGLQDCVHWCWAFRPVHDQCALGWLDQLRFFGFEKPRCARVLGFPDFVRMLAQSLQVRYCDH